MNDNELILTEKSLAEERYQWDKLHIARFYWEEKQLDVNSAKYPVRLSSIGTFRLTNSLDRESKAINMSRLIEQLQQSRGEGLSDRNHLFYITLQNEEKTEEPPSDFNGVSSVFLRFYERSRCHYARLRTKFHPFGIRHILQMIAVPA